MPISQDMLKQLTDTQQLPQPYVAPILSATFKSSPADFKVDEMMQVQLTGAGEHLWLQIQKSGMNTVYVAEQLAKWANVPKRDVGFSGMKDRQAITTQWFSVRIPKKQAPPTPFAAYLDLNHHNSQHALPEDKPDETLTVLSQNWHSKKLNRGTHRANHFEIGLDEVILNPALLPTDLAEGLVAQGLSAAGLSTNADVSAHQLGADKRLTEIGKHGVPNYFGAQRFGHQGNNVAQALEWLTQGTINGRKPHPKKSRELQSLLLSAGRSAIFNQILARRVSDGTWDTGMDGEVFNLAGSGSVFASEQLDDTLRQRLVSGDIYATAPLWGSHNDKVTGAAKRLEDDVVSNNPVLSCLASGLEAKQLKTMRRALRLPIADFAWQWQPPKRLLLSFTLPTGTFATSVLASVVKTISNTASNPTANTASHTASM